MKNYIIAIDGPAGVGKSSLAKEISKRLSFLYVDSGAMYRAVGLYCIENKINADIAEDVVKALDKINIEIENNDNEFKIFLNGEDVCEKIRTPAASVYSSKVAVIKEVREKLIKTQREIAKGKSILMDGRDIGTKVFPNADVKIFLIANEKVRAQRRFLELKEKGQELPFDDILNDMTARDLNDTKRKFDPLKQADDAVLVDNTNLSFEETVEHVLKIIRGVIL